MTFVQFTDRLVAALGNKGVRLLTGGQQIIFPDLVLEPPCSVHGFLTRMHGLGAYSYIGAPGVHSHVTYGRYCSIAGDVHVGEQEHPTNWLSTSNLQYDRAVWDQTTFTRQHSFSVMRPTIVGNDVWIGQGAFIKAGVTIGNGAIVAARAVVTENVAPYQIVGGVPARVLRSRFNRDQIERLEALAWWRFKLDDFSDCPFPEIDRAIDFLRRRLPDLAPYAPKCITGEEIAVMARDLGES